MQANEVDKKFTTARMALKKGDVLKCLTLFKGALEGLGATHASAEEKAILENGVTTLQAELTAHEGFKKIFGPVTFADADTESTAAFLGELIKVYSEQIAESLREEPKAPETRMTATSAGSEPAPAQEEAPAGGTASPSPEDRVEEIMMQIGRGRFDEARALIAGDEDILTRVVRRLNSHGISCRKAGQLGEAANSFESAILVCDDDEGLFFNLTRVYMEGGRMPQAMETIRKALAINPGFREGKALLERIALKMAA